MYTASLLRRPNRRVRLLAACAVLASGALVLSGCSSTTSASTKKEVSVGVDDTSFSFSPSSQDRMATSLVYDFLFSHDTSGYHARAATYSYNTGNTVLSITLRKGLTFADGSAIDADVIKANILWAKDNGAFFSSITGVDVTGDQTLVVHQSHADQNVMLSLFAMPIVSTDTLKDPKKFADEPDSSGPYRLEKKGTTSGATYAFSRNPHYWDAKHFPYDKVSVKLLSDETSRINALKSGQIDVAPVGATTAADAKGSGFTLNQFYSGTAGMILGDRAGKILKPLGDVRVRQAMNMAFDRKAMVKSIYAGYAKPSSQPFQEGTPGYQSDEANKYAYDPKGAKKLLSEAGYPNGFALTLPTYEPITGSVQSYIKQALGDIGIRVTFQAFNDDTWVGAFSGGKYPVATLGLPFSQTADTADPSFFWNPWHNSDPKAVSLLGQINAGTPAQAAKATDALGKLQLDDAWWVVWATPATIWASTTDVKVNAPQYADWVSMYDIQTAK
ncbi:peptide ABC transporter substrate-binding protein [Frondihabitans sucicola]|uniref:Peptide ABC transporter substrate-binding protein n=1 Tax=Frondihabitans sucicola TaxID=1268041 RepID=A0ABM8GUI3_9MICO|nr:ABC transporter substrate-binding protein [Frondihabitans sucicola]BDZ52039.1 peptide ABC transporter substrate-binding protein [Frondihabitans sucicola]